MASTSALLLPPRCASGVPVADVSSRPLAPPCGCANCAGREETCDGVSQMDEMKIDREAMGRLAKALAFICGADHPTTVALKAAAESGSDRDIKTARALFLGLKQSDRRAALAMLDD